VILAVLLVIVVAISEETIFRGYLLLRARALNPGTLFGVVFSALIFSLGHGYEGWAGVITIGISGAVLAGIYLWRGSLVAPIVLHFLQDLSTLVIAPLLIRHR
jgi:membrane protease YdiL (CAAX protease family)